MAVWNDLAAGWEVEFDRWYQRQHLLERLQVPGFREARRYVAESGSPRYCAFYWLDSVGVLNTPIYLERLAHPTRWTQRMMPAFRAMARTPGTVTLDRGSGVGGAMTWIAGLGSDADPAALRAAFARCFDLGMQDADIVRLQFWECDPAVAGLANPEARLRASSDRVAEWVAYIEGADARSVAACRSSILEAAGRLVDVRELVVAPEYRLTRRLLAAEAPPPCSDDAAGVTFSR